MIHYLLVPLAEYIESFRLFESVHLRALCAGLTAFLIGIVVGPGIIERLGQLKWRERIASDSAKLTALHKQPTLDVKHPNGGQDAVLQVVPASLSLENLNNVWATQLEVSHRPSVAYELALVPAPWRHV